MSNQIERKIQLKNVVLSFPSVFKEGSFNGNGTGKYEATFMLPKSDKKGYEAVKGLIDDIKAANPKTKVASDKIFLKDGDETGDEVTEGFWLIRTGKNVAKGRPTLIDRDKSPLMEEDGKMYGGAIVNAIIGAWLQDNAYGKRINGNLYGIQFVEHGEPLGGGSTDVTDDFDDFDDEEDL